MKKLRSIFVFVFLAGMLFTVFQYIPLIEETQGHTTELAKKSCEDDHSDDDSAESDGDDAITAFFNFNFSKSYCTTFFRQTKKDEYNRFIQKINVPPPQA